MHEEVLDIFRQICSIPRGSGNTEWISDFCTNFAANRGLRYYRDNRGNVIIYKSGTFGYETSPTVIIQGHLDMVCVKTPEADINFKMQGIKIHETEDYIEGKSSSLGGDDGIAVAYALALLDSKDISHPPLEVVLTVDEEIGMLGAKFLDTSSLSGKMLINIDSEEEGTLLVSCAGGVRADATIPLYFEECGCNAIKINLSGLTGGHSGTEIDKNRRNAIITLAQILEKIEGIKLVSFDGGSADNAIPTDCSCVITSKNIDETKTAVNKIFEQIKADSPNDSEMTLNLEDTFAFQTVSLSQTQLVFSCISNVPNGVISYSQKIEGLVQTSLSLGTIETTNSEIRLCHAIRSSYSVEKDNLRHRLFGYYTKHSATVKFHSDYPAWEFKENSKLQRIFTETYKEMYGEPMNVSAIHAGLECGLFCGKIKGLDCVSMGPNIYNIHTTDEKLSKKSSERVFNLLVKVLEKLV